VQFAISPPFISWCAAIAVAGLDRQVRLGLFAISFHVFRDWIRIAVITEAIGLARYLNSVIFFMI
jgi:hypothetical protein